jgi:hypothetical protein
MNPAAWRTDRIIRASGGDREEICHNQAGAAAQGRVNQTSTWGGYGSVSGRLAPWGIRSEGRTVWDFCQVPSGTPAPQDALGNAGARCGCATCQDRAGAPVTVAGWRTRRRPGRKVFFRCGLRRSGVFANLSARWRGGQAPTRRASAQKVACSRSKQEGSGAGAGRDEREPPPGKRGTSRGGIAGLVEASAPPRCAWAHPPASGGIPRGNGLVSPRK